MPALRKYVILLAAILLVVGCKHKKKPSLSGEDPVEVNDFIDFYKEVKLPFQIEDTSALKKNNDSLLISYKVFTQFVPDSVINKTFGKGVKPKFYAVGKVIVPKQDIYLFTKAESGGHTTVLLSCFDKKQNFIAAMPFLKPDDVSNTFQFSGLDKRLSIYKTIQRKNADGSMNEGKDVYVLNNDGKNFMLILTDPLDDAPAELINPIDTLPRKNKFSADYAVGKMNLVSVRDAKKNDKIRFFIHFEKSKGDCIGELKGEAVMKSATMAEYRTGSDPCVLQLLFTPSSVTIKEIEGCGSHRGLHCVFEGSFPRKKEVKPKKKK